MEVVKNRSARKIPRAKQREIGVVLFLGVRSVGEFRLERLADACDVTVVTATFVSERGREREALFHNYYWFTLGECVTS